MSGLFMNYQEIISKIYDEIKCDFGKGKVADYIPALANINCKKYGVAISTISGAKFNFGDAEERFSIQSISKVFTLTMAFGRLKENIWQRVGKEPSGNPFNSLVQLEYENGRPRNPFINAGALVLADIVLSEYEHPQDKLLEFVRELSGNKDINFDLEVAASEKEKGFRNAALGNFMKSFGNITNNIDAVLDFYFHQCSISMSCIDLARSFLFLANHGIIPGNKKKILTMSESKRISSLMLTCGLYDESGDFAFRTGMPGKSGVGGGIVAVIPKELAICVWSPELNKHGNSHLGVETLERFTTMTGVSIF